MEEGERSKWKGKKNMKNKEGRSPCGQKSEVGILKARTEGKGGSRKGGNLLKRESRERKLSICIPTIKRKSSKEERAFLKAFQEKKICRAENWG